MLDQLPYSFPVDIWAFGVMVYALMSSSLPYPQPKAKLTKENRKVFARLIKGSELEFQGKEWLLISDALKDLLMGMLEKDPSKRLTIDGVLQHPWFKQ